MKNIIMWFKLLFKLRVWFRRIMELENSKIDIEKRLSDLESIWHNYSNDMEKMVHALNKAEDAKRIAENLGHRLEWIFDKLDVGVDISAYPQHSRDPSYAIIVGRYRFKDYVRCFNIPHDAMEDIINRLREIEKVWGNIRFVDAPPTFAAFLDNELGRKKK